MSTKHQRGGSRNATAARAEDRRLLTSRRSRRRRTATVGGITLGLTAATLAGMPAQAINTNPPEGPGNIEIFTKRDMVAIEGYSEFAGKQAQFSVIRDGVLVGSAIGTVDGTGFLESNHPGGICWGEGTGLKVTPNIRGGDEVRVDFLGTGQWDAAVARDVEIDSVERNDASRSLTIGGRFGPGVDLPGADLVADPGKFGVEIVNPDMRTGTSINERAIGWPEEPADPADPEPPAIGWSVTGGITEGAEGGEGRFAVTFTFDKLSDLDLAEAGEHVALAWQENPDPSLGDIEFERGLTLWENGESAGPGMGGCPAGPQEIRADSPTAYTGKGAGENAGIAVTWDAATVAPDAPAITGYSVRAVSGENEVGKRVGADARSTTLTGLTDGDVYTVEIASRNANGESSPVASMRLRAGAHTVPGATATTLREPNADGKYQPLVTTAAGADFGVHLDPVPGLLDAEVHYTTDGSTPTLDSPTFVSGDSESLQVRQDTTIKWVVVDSGNIVGPVGQKFFDIVESQGVAPEITRVVPGAASGTVDVTFGKRDGAAAYRVQAYTGDSADVLTGVRVGNPVTVLQPTDETVTEITRRVPGLTNGTPYKFSVAARYGNAWSSESGLSAAVAPEPAPKADAGADQTVLRGRPFTLDGGKSAKVVSYQWTQVRPTTANNGGLPQDPAFDLNPDLRGVQATTGPTDEPTLALTFPILTTPTSDHDLQFRLTTTHENADGTTFKRNDLVDITGQADTVVAEEARWRAGDEIGGTGSQENATLTLHVGSPTGPVIPGSPIVTNGEWTQVAGTPALAEGSQIYVWSNYGFTGYITVED